MVSFGFRMSTLLLLLGAVYLGLGFVFAVAFAFFGARRIDPHAAQGSWGFRLLIIPGAMALWPILLRRWLLGLDKPPEEDNAHRRAARANAISQATNPAQPWP